MGDKIDKLPVDDNAIPSKSDVDMIGALFQNGEKTGKVAYEFKDGVIGAILFVLISSHQFDRAIRSSGCHNELYVLGIKLLFFIILFYILKNRF